MVAFSGIGHVALRVRDIERSLEFYTRHLGFPEMLRLAYSDGSLFLIYLRIAGGSDFDYRPLFSFIIGLTVSSAAFVSMGLFFMNDPKISRAQPMS